MKVCKKCGGSDFNTSNKCRPCNKEYYRLNKEKIITQMRERFAKNREKSNAARREYYYKNIQKEKTRSAIYQKSNRSRSNLYSKNWRENNIEKANRAVKNWSESNKELRKIYSQNRRARVRQAAGSFTKTDIQELLILQKNKCVVCNSKLKGKYHIDHIMPLSKGGSNDKLNIQLLCQTCNLKKHAKHPIDFMQSMGFLL